MKYVFQFIIGIIAVSVFILCYTNMHVRVKFSGIWTVDESLAIMAMLTLSFIMSALVFCLLYGLFLLFYQRTRHYMIERQLEIADAMAQLDSEKTDSE